MRRHISKEVKDLALCMSLLHGLSNKHVARYTGISIRALTRLRRTYRQTGQTVRIPAMYGRFNLEGCIERQPDMSLVELKETIL
ncbi:hypothetical protein C8Q80DRAFT_1055452, partial [Daedaleopsis nitida]